MSNQTDAQKADQVDGGGAAAKSEHETPADKLKRPKPYIVKGKNNRDKYLNDHQETFVNYIESKHGLLDSLVAKGVINERQLAEIKGTGTGEKTVYRQNEELLQIIRTVEDEKYLKFLEILAGRHKDIVQILTGDQWEQPEQPSNC